MSKQFYIYSVLALLISCTATDPKQIPDTEKTSTHVPVNQVVGIGKIEPENEIIQLCSPVNGIVQKIIKNENDQVSAGTVILELDHQVEDAKSLQAARQVESQAAQIKADEAAVSEYIARVQNASSDLQRLKNLLGKGAETQQNVDNANTTLLAYQATLNKLMANVENSKSKLAEAKAALQVAEAEQEQKIIRSPVNGKILEINTLVGSSVDTRESFVQIRPEGKTISVCEIDEMYADKIKNGQKATIRNVGSTSPLCTGTVYFTSDFLKKKSLFTDQSGEKEDRRVRTVKILLDQPDKLLLNARVECVIDVTGKTDK